MIIINWQNGVAKYFNLYTFIKSNTQQQFYVIVATGMYVYFVDQCYASDFYVYYLFVSFFRKHSMYSIINSYEEKLQVGKIYMYVRLAEFAGYCNMHVENSGQLGALI